MIFEKQILNVYRSMMFTRCDDVETVKYFSGEDFQGLKAEPCQFKSSLGHTLKGYFYEYDNPVKDRLIVFDHGFGGGHRAYMTEIEKLCRHGYRVFSYDHSGCMESGGDGPNGLSQSLRDLNDCISALKQDSRFATTDISVVGHSWGAFSTMNIVAYHPEISHIVAISGFVSVEEMVKTFFAGLLKGYRRPVMKLETESNPEFVHANAITSLTNSDTKALLIYSENDALCKISHYNLLKNALAEKPNIRFILEKNKGHNPNYTEAAVALLGEFSKRRTKLLKKKNVSAEEKASFVSSFDFSKMTEQDEKLWCEIFRHLDA